VRPERDRHGTDPGRPVRPRCDPVRPGATRKGTDPLRPERDRPERDRHGTDRCRPATRCDPNGTDPNGTDGCRPAAVVVGGHASGSDWHSAPTPWTASSSSSIQASNRPMVDGLFFVAEQDGPTARPGPVPKLDHEAPAEESRLPIPAEDRRPRSEHRDGAWTVAQSEPWSSATTGTRRSRPDLFRREERTGDWAARGAGPSSVSAARRHPPAARIGAARNHPLAARIAAAPSRPRDATRLRRGSRPSIAADRRHPPAARIAARMVAATSACPARSASSAAVRMSTLWAFGSAPCARSRSTVAASPPWAAPISGV
jgi:hypothetical protein